METARHVNFDKYAEFVDAVTSDASKDFLSLSDRLVALDNTVQPADVLGRISQRHAVEALTRDQATHAIARTQG